MNFLDTIFAGLRRHPERVVLQVPRGSGVETLSGSQLLDQVAQARRFLRGAGLRPGDRCVLLAGNSARWVAMDLAIMAENLVKVPLYARQAPRELAEMMRDSDPARIVCGDAALRDAIRAEWPDSPPVDLLDAVFESDVATLNAPAADTPPVERPASSLVTIMYTSGTSGVAKGVMLTVANLDSMLPQTMSRLDALMRGFTGQERVFHYLPFCFTGSWILLLTSLTRRSLLTLCTDLDQLAAHMQIAKPHYFLNVPLLLERIRTGIDAKMQQRGPIIAGLYDTARAAWDRRQRGTRRPLDAARLGVANAILFRAVRARISPNLRALICGSAPLSAQTQLFFEMMRIPVLQVYGLTETTAICTMDLPQGPRAAGRVGVAIPGLEMRLGEDGEIWVRGANVFAGYWRRPEATAACMHDDWFRTGDRGEVDAGGNWRIVGRVKNVVVLSSGHNVAPDPIETELRQRIAACEQVVVVGHERPFLTAIVTGDVQRPHVDAAIAAVNADLPHYKRVRAVLVRRDPFTVENGYLTANGKLKRQLVLEHMAADIDAMYAEERLQAPEAARG